MRREHPFPLRGTSIAVAYQVVIRAIMSLGDPYRYGKVPSFAGLERNEPLKFILRSNSEDARAQPRPMHLFSFSSSFFCPVCTLSMLQVSEGHKSSMDRYSASKRAGVGQGAVTRFAWLLVLLQGGLSPLLCEATPIDPTPLPTLVPT